MPRDSTGTRKAQLGAAACLWVPLTLSPPPVQPGEGAIFLDLGHAICRRPPKTAVGVAERGATHANFRWGDPSLPQRKTLLHIDLIWGRGNSTLKGRMLGETLPVSDGECV